MIKKLLLLVAIYPIFLNASEPPLVLPEIPDVSTYPAEFSTASSCDQPYRLTFKCIVPGCPIIICCKEREDTIYLGNKHAARCNSARVLEANRLRLIEEQQQQQQLIMYEIFATINTLSSEKMD